MRATNLWAWGVLLGLAASGCGPATGRRFRPAQVTKDKPGYGGLSGVVVDHATGDVYVCVSDLGLFRSTDQGKTWAQLDHGPPKGRTEQPGCLLIDPTGKSKRPRRGHASTAGPSPSAISESTSGAILDDKSSHVDWCAVDWTDPDLKFILALKHESGGTLIVSHDGGKTFDEVGKGYGPAWVFDKDTAVVAEAKTKDKPKPGLVRTDRRRQDVPAVRRLRGDGAAEVARRRPVLADGRRPDPHHATPARPGRRSAT